MFTDVGEGGERHCQTGDGIGRSWAKVQNRVQVSPQPAGALQGGAQGHPSHPCQGTPFTETWETSKIV